MTNTKNNEIISASNGQKREIIKQMTDVEFHPAIINEPANMSNYNKFPISQITAAGTAFDSIAAAFQQVVSGGQATSGLYRVTVPNGGTLMQFKDGSGYLGSVKAANGGVGGGQAVLNPLVCNPATLCMAMTLMSMDKKLDRIQELQREMFEYVKLKDKAILKANLKFLADILNNYKYHWNNDTFKQTQLIKTQDIKQSAEGSIEHYRSLINSKMHKKGFLQTDQQVQKILREVENLFQDYSLALYIHAFASYLEVMLFENFDSGYLHSIIDKIDNCSIKYRELYTDSYNRIERSLKGSVQGQLLGGLASFNRGAGNVAERIPLIEKTPLDEGLKRAGNTFYNIKRKNIRRRMQGLVSAQANQVRPFVDNIKMIDILYNEPFELMFDEEYLYLKE